MVTAWSKAKSNRREFNWVWRLPSNMADKADTWWKVPACQSGPEPSLFLLAVLSLCQSLERYMPWLFCWSKEDKRMESRAAQADHR